MMLKLKLQYFGHLMQRVDSLEKTLMLEELGAGGERDDRGWDGWMASPTRWTWVWVNSGSRWQTGRPGVLQFMGSQRIGHDWATELNWTGLQPPGFSVHGDSPGKNTGVGCYALLQGIFLTQGSNPGLLHCPRILYRLSHEGSPKLLEWAAYPFSRGPSWPRSRTEVSCIAGGFFI